LKDKHITVVVLKHPEYAALSSIIDKAEFDSREESRDHLDRLREVYRGDQYALISMASPFVLDDYVRVLATERMEGSYY